MDLFHSVAPKDYNNVVKYKDEEIEHIRLDDVFNKKDEELLKPIFSDSTKIESDSTYDPNFCNITCNISPSKLNNTLYAIKNFCSSYLSFQNNLDEMLKIDKKNSTQYTSRFTHPINEIKFDLEELRYTKIQDQLLKMFKYIEVDFNINVIETENILPIYDKVAVKDDKYYIQPEVENIINRLIISDIIPPREIIIVDALDKIEPIYINTRKFEIINSMIKLGINDYQMCNHCRFKTICLKSTTKKNI